jgi:hypothetical protein
MKEVDLKKGMESIKVKRTRLSCDSPFHTCLLKKSIKEVDFKKGIVSIRVKRARLSL